LLHSLKIQNARPFFNPYSGIKKFSYQKALRKANYILAGRSCVFAKG
jgi:hypothetical protein